ncbi:type I-U CRISPR-associated helicase/endonuclease Cas3, partial [Amycolatopsis sp. H6(2020)]|nr:type I-U CRISPR-associated helicase/endonuclease Cas3 [Amycolatopsis sp. H6(2020)]
MSLTIERFDEFFAALHGQDRVPYRWQRELLERLLSTGRWPQQLDIPTGGGKSTAIEIHVFANAVAQQRTEEGREDAPRVPRRLSMIVARRAVVDDHLTRASTLMEALDLRRVLRGPARAGPRTLPLAARAPGAAAVHRALAPAAGHPDRR